MGDRARASLPYFALAVLCGAIGIYLALSQTGERKLERAGEDLRAGRYADALAELEGVDGQGSRQAAALRGYAHLGRGQYERAAPELSAAVRRAPNDWVLQRDYAIVLRTIGRRAAARARMQRALSLNPRMALPRGFRAVERLRSGRRRR